MLERAGAVSARVRMGLPAEFGLIEGGYRLSDAQAQAILDMRLNRLTGLEQDKIIAEFQELLDADSGPGRHPGAARAPACR